MQSSLRERIAHLLRRAGLSASRTEIERFLPLGIEGAVDRLLAYDQQAETIDDEAILSLLRGESPRLQPPMVANWWLYRMLVTQRPLQERMALFWHNHFATSASKVGDGNLMLIQIQMFQRLALADFKTLVIEVSKDPAMLVWLDGVRNVKGKPNENFARELLELFTMGIGHYTERDIQEGARAFTGWSFSRATRSFVFNRAQHDDGEKLFLGKRGRFTGEEIIQIAVEHPATAEFMARKFYRFFINDVDRVEERAVRAFAQEFMQSGYSVRALMRKILLSDAFWSPANYRRRIKSPVEFVVSTLRQVGIGERLRQLDFSSRVGQRALVGYLRVATQWARRIGQALLYPPSVAGWNWGTAWISSQTMLERMRFAEFVILNRGPLGSQNLLTLIGEEPPQTLDAFIDRLEEVLDVPLQTETCDKIRSYLQARGGVSALRRPERALIRNILQIVFASPEYQMM